MGNLDFARFVPETLERATLANLLHEVNSTLESHALTTASLRKFHTITAILILVIPLTSGQNPANA